MKRIIDMMQEQYMLICIAIQHGLGNGTQTANIHAIL